jgi:hypothetical protein
LQRQNQQLSPENNVKRKGQKAFVFPRDPSLLAGGGKSIIIRAQSK